MSGEYVPRVTFEMVEAGVSVFEALEESYAPHALVERIYIAMRALETAPKSDGHPLTSAKTSASNEP
jgi:hypothetical protein